MLGTFEVRTDDGAFADVPGARLRALLTALALEPGHAVPKAALVDWIWGERPPSDAANALQRLASRLRMLGTISEYAADRLAEAGEAELARQAHLGYFTRLAETAEPHLRRAEQLEWLATLEAEHDNMASAMRGALAAGEARAAMRLAAGAGWYWWLGGHRAEGIELITAAAGTPGEVSDETRAIVYALVVMFMTAGPADEYQAEEWIHKAYRFSQLSLRSQSRHPALGLVAPLERMLQAPGEFLPAWEQVLDDEDPWVRALARLQLGKMRVMLGQGGRDADAYLEKALA